MADLKWLALALVVASWLFVLRFFRGAKAQDARMRVALDEEDRRRRALESVAKPMSANWRLTQGYAKDGRDHR